MLHKWLHLEEEVETESEMRVGRKEIQRVCRERIYTQENLSFTRLQGPTKGNNGEKVKTVITILQFLQGLFFFSRYGIIHIL